MTWKKCNELMPPEGKLILVSDYMSTFIAFWALEHDEDFGGNPISYIGWNEAFHDTPIFDSEEYINNQGLIWDWLPRLPENKD